MAVIKNSGYKLVSGEPVPAERDISSREHTMAYRIMRHHSVPNSRDSIMRIKFDALISHDITYVGIIQTAMASGLTEFPVPYVLTNCHNSLGAVGGTINEDDHAFGLSAARKFGGIFVPPNMAVIHQYAREVLAGCDKMILGSDSHTRYGFMGAMGIGEGGGELTKQLLRDTYDIEAPEVILVWVSGAPKRGVGPHDIALDLVSAAFPDGFAKNKILEFAGPGVAGLSMDFRAGIDVMTTETSCLSSIWITDDRVREYYKLLRREGDFSVLQPNEGAYYDAMIELDLTKSECMIALPFHPSKAVLIHALQANPREILAQCERECNSELSGARLDLVSCIHEDGKVHAEQGIIVGCAGGMFENISEAADILAAEVSHGRGVGDGYFDLSVYPASAPQAHFVTKSGVSAQLQEYGAIVKPSFCGPCFGAGDTPANNTLSIRHATRNFASREGSRPQDGQAAAVALMDARSIAATAARGGILTAASDIEYTVTKREYVYNDLAYKTRVFNGFGSALPETELRFGPNIAAWPDMPPLGEHLLLQLAAVIKDDVTTTDELIPSGETSSYRSNPKKLARFAISRRCPQYVQNADAIAAIAASGELRDKFPANTTVASAIYAKKPGDGSAREQAASCQKVLGGYANIAREYATKRYRSNCVNWGIIPFIYDGEFPGAEGDRIFIPNVRDKLLSGSEAFEAKLLSAAGETDIILGLPSATADERRILAAGCLMNDYRNTRI